MEGKKIPKILSIHELKCLQIFSKTFNSFWRFFELSFTEKLFFSDNFHLKIYIGNILMFPNLTFKYGILIT